jgi:hypothetical protein
MWLEDEGNLTNLRSLAESLKRCFGLQDMPENTIEALGDLVDAMIRDESNKEGTRGSRIFGGSRLFKWLSAWACHHVPMIDNELHHALTGLKWPASPECHHSSKLLNDYKHLLDLHFEHLEFLGKQLFNDLNGLLPAPLPPVRVLDNLLWFDWVGCKRPEFNGIWFRYQCKAGHDLSDAGIEFLRNRDDGREQ